MRPARTSNRPALTRLLIATALFALGPVVIKALVTRGGAFGVTHAGALSFCNVLFVGNLCAGIVVLLVYGGGPLVRELRGLSGASLGILLIGAVASAAYPALIFTALERTSVINVVLLSRFNGIALVVVSFLFFGTAVRAAEAVGYGLIAIGVATLLFVNNSGLRLSTGETLVLFAAIFYVLIEVVNKSAARRCSVPTYLFFRNFVSAVIFFFVAVVRFGFDHFADAFERELWALMIVYAAFAVVAAQMLWLRATGIVSVQTVANTQLLNPALSVLFAFLLLNERPSVVEWLVMAIVGAGMLIPRLVRAHVLRRAVPHLIASMTGVAA